MLKRVLFAFCAVVAVALIGGCGGGSAPELTSAPPTLSPGSQRALPAAAPQPADRVEPMVATGLAAPQALKARRSADMPVAAVVALGAPAAGQKRAAASAGQPAPGSPQQTGFARDIARTAAADGTQALLAWRSLSGGGQSAAISFRSAEAMGLRLGLLVRQLPDAAVLRIYTQGNASSVFEISGREVNALILRNLAAGDSDDMARTWWAPHVDGSEATLEIELPSGVPASALQVAVPRLVHFFAPVLTQQSAGPQRALSASCEIDVSCYNFDSESNATAKMSYVDRFGDAYVCTGTLLNDRASSGTPYFLSANHCISTQTSASSLITYWLYRSASCNSTAVNPGLRVRFGGATLLYASAATDTSFMRLADPAPAGATYAGWLSSGPSINAQVTAFHHPSGDLQKISFGTVTGFNSCTATSLFSETFSCSSATLAGKFVGVLFSSGTTESGSSGSGLFQTVGTGRYLVGQLRGGSSSCTNRSGSNYYGRFDVAYQAALSQWLDAPAPSTLSVRKAGSGGGLVYSWPTGIYCGTSCSASFTGGTVVSLTAAPNTGSAFTGWSGACSGSSTTCSLPMNSALEAVANFDSASSVSAMASALDNASLAWTTGGGAPFVAQNAYSNYGGSAMQTGAITHSQSTYLSTVVTGPGTLSFDWKVSSEEGYDFFTVYLDGAAQYHWSGLSDWYRSSFTIPAGAHTVKWEYVKDNLYSSGWDSGWVDHVVFTPSAATVSSTDRVFNWAEVIYPGLFTRPSVAGTYQGYTYRFYPSTGNYLATSNGRVVVHNGRDWQFKDVGDLAGFLSQAAAAGF